MVLKKSLLLTTVFLLFSILLVGCDSSEETSIKINGPPQCVAGERNIFSLDGSYDKTADFVWESSTGEIEFNKAQAWTTPSIDVNKLTITVIISGKRKAFTKSYTCDVIPPPTSTLTTSTPTITITPTNTITPTITPTIKSESFTIAISEVFGDACGDTEADIYYEYIEIFNYGLHPVDIKGLWITVSSRNDTEPQEITSWDDRFPFNNLSSRLISNSTIIQPKSFALIVSPQYLKGIAIYPVPYLYPEDTTILTVKNGTRLGGSATGIIGSSDFEQRDPVVLYEGSYDWIEKVIDTYGAPEVGPNPSLITGKGYHNFPLFLGDCHSATRIEPTQPDYPSNWEVTDPSPGVGFELDS